MYWEGGFLFDVLLNRTERKHTTLVTLYTIHYNIRNFFPLFFFAPVYIALSGSFFDGQSPYIHQNNNTIRPVDLFMSYTRADYKISKTQWDGYGLPFRFYDCSRFQGHTHNYNISWTYLKTFNDLKYQNNRTWLYCVYGTVTTYSCREPTIEVLNNIIKIGTIHDYNELLLQPRTISNVNNTIQRKRRRNSGIRKWYIIIFYISDDNIGDTAVLLVTRDIFNYYYLTPTLTKLAGRVNKTFVRLCDIKVPNSCSQHQRVSYVMRNERLCKKKVVFQKRSKQSVSSNGEIRRV